MKSPKQHTKIYFYHLLIQKSKLRFSNIIVPWKKVLEKAQVLYPHLKITNLVLRVHDNTEEFFTMLGLDCKSLINPFPWQTKKTQPVLTDSEMLHFNFPYVPLTSWLSSFLNVSLLGEWDVSVLFVMLLLTKTHTWEVTVWEQRTRTYLLHWQHLRLKCFQGLSALWRSQLVPAHWKKLLKNVRFIIKRQGIIFLIKIGF